MIRPRRWWWRLLRLPGLALTQYRAGLDVRANMRMLWFVLTYKVDPQPWLDAARHAAYGKRGSR